MLILFTNKRRNQLLCLLIHKYGQVSFALSVVKTQKEEESIEYELSVLHQIHIHTSIIVLVRT